MSKLLPRSLVFGGLGSLLLAVLVASIGGAVLHACLDVQVIHVDEPGSDGGGGPGHDLDVASDAPRPCELCMNAPSDPGPGCAQEVAICAADRGCHDTMVCAVAARCLELSGMGTILDCGTPCGRDAGLDLSSPSLTYLFDVLACAQDSCGPICRGEVSPPSLRAR
jgi:hypothetical protein